MRSWVAVLILLVSAPFGPAGAQEVRARLDGDTTVLRVGDRLRLTVRVDHPASSSVRWPDSLDLAPFEVLEAAVSDPRPAGDGLRSELRVVATVFELGDLEVPGVPVEVVGPEGRTTRTVTDGFGVSVMSVGLDEGDAIREIRGPLALPLGLASLLPYLLLVAAAAAAVWWWRRREEEAQPVATVVRAPHEVAYEALDRLEASGYLVRGEVKAYHVELSDIVRAYVEAVYRVRALEMTTFETLDALGRRGLGGDVLENLRTLLEHCDLVKFAKVRPPSDRSLAMLELAREIVDATRSRVGSTEGADRDAASGEATAAGEGPTGEARERSDEVRQQTEAERGATVGRPEPDDEATATVGEA